LLDAEGALSAATTVGLLWQAACALKAIHEQGIVHRDLKPANLYLKTRDDGSLELKVLDFSISRLLDRAGERKTTIVVGTRGFMAPEQAAGYDVDHRADIFSLGQVASTLLRGPVKHDEPAPEDPLARFKGFRAWHARATAYDREHRFASAIQAVEALADVLDVALPKRESIKTDAAESMTAAATILGASARPPLLRTWALAGVAGIGTVVSLLLLNRTEPAGELPQSGSSQVPPVSVAASGMPAVPAASTMPVAASAASAPVADTSARPSARASSEPPKPSSPTPKRSAPSRAPARQRPSDTF
jgi:serine/threonine-protein kinase